MTLIDRKQDTCQLIPSVMSTFTQPNTDTAKPMKLAILSPRFWPCSGSDELALSDLAQTLAKQDHEVEIITPGWNTSLPAAFRFRNFNVQRIYRSTSAPWGGFRYQKNLLRYLTQNPVNQLIFFNAFSEFVSLAKSLAGKTPMTMRLHDHALTSLAGSITTKNRRTNLLKIADRVLVESESTFQLLLAAGLPIQKLAIVPEGILPPDQPTTAFASQAVARQAVSNSHGMLTINPEQPLLVCGALMDGDKGMLDLVQAWKLVLRKIPAAKLWIVSQGTSSRNVWDAITSKKMIDSIIMPGQFDNYEDVFRAADAYLHPLRGSFGCSMLTRAMMSNLCPIVTEPTATVLGLTNNRQANTAAAGNPENLSNVIVQTIQNPIERIQIGLAAADWAMKRFHISQTANQYLGNVPAPNTPRPLSKSLSEN